MIKSRREESTHPAPQPGDRKTNRKLISLASAGMMQHGIVLLLFGPVLPEMMKTFQIRESLAGLMLGMGSLGFMAAPILAGVIADRRGVRWSLTIGFLIELAFLALVGLSPFLIWAFVAILVLKFGAGFIETSLNVIPTFAGHSKPGALMNLVHMFFSIGALICPLIVGAVLQAMDSWRPVFWLAVAPTAVLLLAALRSPLPQGTVSRSRQASRKPSASRKRLALRKQASFSLPTGTEHADGDPTRTGRPLHLPSTESGSVLLLLRKRSVLMGAVVLFLYVGAEVGISDWIVLYLQEIPKFSTLGSTTGLSVYWIGILVGRFINSVLARYRSGRELILGAGVLGLIFGLVMLAARAPAAVYPCLFILGVAMSGVFPIVMAELNSRDPSLSGRVTGILAVAASLGAAVFVPVLGVVAEWLGLIVALGIPAVLMGILGLLYLFVKHD